MIALGPSASIGKIKSLQIAIMKCVQNMSLGNIIIYGAGSIGSTIGGWITQRHANVYLVARGEHAEIMKQRGLTLYGATSQKPETSHVNLIDDLSEASDAKVLILTVKNYDVERAAKSISSKLGDETIIVALQNGVENQRTLPKYFSKVIYGVVGYSAEVEKPGVVRYQSRGPVYLGTVDNELEYSIEEICYTFNLSFEAEITPRLQDTVHCKIVLNLTNALFTLAGLNYRKFSSFTKLATITSTLLNEGIDIITAAGYKEYRMKNYPSWRTIRLGLKLPSFVRTLVLRRNVEHAILNSMGQDVLLKRKKETELECLNGYIIRLADSVGAKAPHNKALYDLCTSEFNRAEFQPLSIEEIWERVQVL
jgi:2-dehydropantoate 2-reductase